jgi:hypothetical protein
MKNQITREQAKKAIGRVSGLSFFPATVGGIGELVDVLQEVARSDGHAARMMDRWLSPLSVEDDVGSVSRHAPKPADLRHLARTTEVREQLPPCCSRCHGQSDFVIVERRDGVTGAARCACARGLALAAADALREGRAPAGLLV